MGESYAKVVLYDLNCDHPNHNRVEFARLDFSDTEGADYRSDAWSNLIEAREAAQRSGWVITRTKVYCPRCAKALTPSPMEREK